MATVRGPRSVDAKKRLIRLLFERLERECGITPIDVEVTIFETPRHNWGVWGIRAIKKAAGV